TSLKTIVLDGSWYDFLEGQALFLRDRCPVDRCRVYRGRAPEGATVDAFIFKDGYSSYYQAIREDERNQTVRILYLLENPQHTPIEKGATGIDWTATYRKDSDIVTPYEKVCALRPAGEDNQARPRLHPEQIQGGGLVDIYGTCGPLECPRHTSEKCYQMVERDYYFYLAFENANCKDYITEKFFNALRHNVVPVVMGASREEYRAAAPHHSYIHVEDFRSPKELAEYLLLLSRNRTLYNEYFRWKGTGEFVNTYFWCRLCALLHAPPRPHQRRSEDVYRWWHTDTSLKTIVLDGSWYDFVDGQTLFLRDRCPVDRCRVYRRRAPEGVTVDATIVKDGYSSYYRPTGEKGRNQGLRILYLLENPMNGPLEEGGALGIDWTATYRKDSDIVTPYEKFVLFDPLVKAIRRDHDYTRNKSKMVAWFVSNCHTENNRLHYAHKLQQHIQVDIYGNCGSLTCSRYETEMCYQMVERDYYFYLAFENANCKDYITEKFFNALRHNVVPVVMGASREEYRAAAPHHSYIHVEDFRSPKELAEYLLLLSRNRTLYNEYFQWKGTGEFVNTYFWCRLCALLHAPPRPHQRRSEDGTSSQRSKLITVPRHGPVAVPPPYAVRSPVEAAAPSNARRVPGQLCHAGRAENTKEHAADTENALSTRRRRPRRPSGRTNRRAAQERGKANIQWQ
ncbi:hypothetical protein V5799_008908, partial [Amblyomma americanum]